MVTLLAAAILSVPAFAQQDARVPLIPKPKTNRLDYTKPLKLSGKYTFPAGRVGMWSEFQMALKRRFEVQPVKGEPIAVDGGEARMGFAPGVYKITITPKSISVLGQDEQGVRYAMERLAQMAFVHEGRIALPTGGLIDQPQTAWRGVHLFVGPKALAFHKKLWRNVLLPMESTSARQTTPRRAALVMAATISSTRPPSFQM